jgi:hypothetical protein
MKAFGDSDVHKKKALKRLYTVLFPYKLPKYKFPLKE